MQVNSELEQLRLGLEAVFARLCPGARLAVITFHSLEDRLVKRSFRRLCRRAPELRRLPVSEEDLAPAARLVGAARRPTAAEVERNPRARSATLRVLERLT